MTQVLLGIQAAVAALATGVVALEVLAPEYVAVIVLVCSVINAGLGAFLGANSGNIGKMMRLR